jgi:hypothetical protein
MVIRVCIFDRFSTVTQSGDGHAFPGPYPEHYLEEVSAMSAGQPPSARFTQACLPGFIRQKPFSDYRQY